MDNLVKPLLSRIAASIIAGLVGYAAGKGFNLDQDTITAAVTFLGGLMFTVYSVVHKTIDKKLNPSDAAAAANIVHGEAIKENSTAL